MRCTMQAILLTLSFSVSVSAQEIVGTTTPSPVHASPQFHSESGLPPVAALGGEEMVANAGCARCASGTGVAFHPMGCDRPYSPLAARMSCNENSPMLWSTYPAERAAAIAHSMRHVNEQCDCLHHRNLLHRQASAPGCGPIGGCHAAPGCDAKPGCDSVVVNRYQVPSEGSEPTLANKSNDRSVFGLKLPSWGGASSHSDSISVKSFTPAPPAAGPTSPYLKSEPHTLKTATLSPVATAPGPVVLAR
ncbi:hypothetical protein VN12_12720 [Pirellula sp. SH-Sr6A]|uniref:hypothetical protein n=1 Tax=Pirellula sp. SH-Sr6A TaxID=1632865 RepID=UPI00078D789C|nr:hypothetical protein [Pirellula sp. SH-Sr6A]AMV32980.1 hypothetical protein VN12_12720 [Pirellula sp. SH-Sr6A]